MCLVILRRATPPCSCAPFQPSHLNVGIHLLSPLLCPASIRTLLGQAIDPVHVGVPLPGVLLSTERSRRLAIADLPPDLTIFRSHPYAASAQSFGISPSPLLIFQVVMPPQIQSRTAVRTLLPSPTADAATPPVSALLPPPLAASRSCLLSPLIPGPSAAIRCRAPTVPGCSSPPEPVATSDDCSQLWKSPIGVHWRPTRVVAPAAPNSCLRYGSLQNDAGLPPSAHTSKRSADRSLSPGGVTAFPDTSPPPIWQSAHPPLQSAPSTRRCSSAAVPMQP